MTRRLTILPGAEADLSAIWDYTVETWSLNQARRYSAGLTALLFSLCDQPEIARRHGKTNPPVRLHRYRSHLVIFTADESVLEVIRIVHARSNWQALLAE